MRFYSTASMLAALATFSLGCAEHAADAGLALDEPRVLAPAGSAAASPMIAVTASGTRAFTWISSSPDGSNNRLFVMTDSMAPVELTDTLGELQGDRETPPKIAYGPDGKLFVLYTVANTRGAFQAGLRVRRSDDGGRTWLAPVSVTDDGALGRYRNDHALHLAADGTIYVGWLDQRSDTIRVYVTHSRDGGATWDTNRMVDRDGSCECCRVSLTSAEDGRVYLAWRKKLPGGIRDIVVARSDDHGTSWSAPSRVFADEWQINGCPDAGPSLAADGNDRLHIGWWTGKPGAAGVKYARSEDGGATFGAPIEMKLGEKSRPSHVQVGLGTAGQVAVTWEDGTVPDSRILVRVSPDGGATFLPAYALSSEGQVAGYPVVGFHGAHFTVLWQERSAAAEAAHKEAAPKNVDFDNLTLDVWRYYNAASGHQVVARTGLLTTTN